MGCGNGQGNAEVRVLEQQLRMLKTQKNSKQSEESYYKLAISLTRAGLKIEGVKRAAEIIRKKIRQQEIIENRQIEGHISDVEKHVSDVETETKLVFNKTGLTDKANKIDKSILNAEYIKKKNKLIELQKELNQLRNFNKTFEEKKIEYNRFMELRKDQDAAKTAADQLKEVYYQLQQKVYELNAQKSEREKRLEELVMNREESKQKNRYSGTISELNNEVFNIDSKISNLRTENEQIKEKLREA